MKTHIISGAATVIAAEKTIQGVLIEGWALPGNKFTANRLHAQVAAEQMGRIMKANGGPGVQPI